MYHKRALCPSQKEDTHTKVYLQRGSFSHQTHVMPAEQEARLINSEVGVPVWTVWSWPANRVQGITGLTWQRPPLILKERPDRKSSNPQTTHIKPGCVSKEMLHLCYPCICNIWNLIEGISPTFSYSIFQSSPHTKKPENVPPFLKNLYLFYNFYRDSTRCQHHCNCGSVS